MDNINKVPSKIIEIEIGIKLLEYLKREKTINDGMYNFCINRLLKNLALEKSKINGEYINSIDNYLILT